jgi:hypothetical protein
MVRAGVGRALDTSEEHLEALGVRVEIPDGPFPIFPLDEAVVRHGRTDVEAKLVRRRGPPFFWVGGLMRENYDLIYPTCGGTEPSGRWRSYAAARSTTSTSAPAACRSQGCRRPPGRC